MKKILFALAALLGIAACEPTEPVKEYELSLIVDKAVIIANGEDAVTFAVKDWEGNAVEDATIHFANTNEALAGMTFKTKYAGEYFYNWASDGTFYFFGADIQNGFTAPATFPVTVSADGNTITIGACQSGAEFGYGIYRPAVFRYGTEPWALATTDITLKRVK